MITSVVEARLCTGCEACKSVCPKHCIHMLPDTEGFYYPSISDGCTRCGRCTTVCPRTREAHSNAYAQGTYACQNKDDQVRLDSSSGGVFWLLVQYVIERNGVVFGAAFDDAFQLKHSYAGTLEECAKYRGSKYLQCGIDDAYCHVKKHLEQGTWVLFSGSPCQVSGLRSFLDAEYDHLLLVDFVCHGVPSQKVFDNYREELETAAGAKARRISFRQKNDGWKRFCVSFLYENDSQYLKPLTEDAFMKGYLANLYLRPSCHSCIDKGAMRTSDVSLADYWGVSSKYPEMDDDKGTSLVLTNTQQGEAVFKQICENMIYLEADYHHACSNNLCIEQSVAAHKMRTRFFELLDKRGFTGAVNICLKRSFLRRCRRFTKAIIVMIKHRLQLNKMSTSR